MNRYQQEFANVSWLIRPQNQAANERHSYFTYFIRVTNGRRDALAKYLYERQIYTTLRFHPLHLNPIYQARDVRLPISEQLNEEGLNLPLHPRLSSDDVTRVIKAVQEFSSFKS